MKSVALKQPLIVFSGSQVNNATARVMTNKKMTTPYSNGEGLAALPYGNAFWYKSHPEGCDSQWSKSISILPLAEIYDK